MVFIYLYFKMNHVIESWGTYSEMSTLTDF